MHRLGWLRIVVVAAVASSIDLNAVEAASQPKKALDRAGRLSPAVRAASRTTPRHLKSGTASWRAGKKKSVPTAKSPEKLALEIADIKTAANAETITLALRRIPGVQSAIVDARIGLAVVDFDPVRAGLPQFVTACRDVGFEAEEYRVENRFPKPIKLKGG